MQWWATCVLLVAMTHGGGGVTNSGIEQFWTDDYKIFEQVYGKTSDKEIYGDTLPSTMTYTRPDRTPEASQKKERFLMNYNDPDAEQLDAYNFANYQELLRQQSENPQGKKQATSSVKVVSYFKPISMENDPATYKYLKHLEEFSNQEKFKSPKADGGFKPLKYPEGPGRPTKSEESDTYRSIQDILDAKKKNKDSSSYEEDSNKKYMSYPKNKRKKPPRVYNDINKPRCVGNCRKRNANYRLRRPYRWTPSLKTVVVI